MTTPATTAEDFSFSSLQFQLNGVLLTWDAEGGMNHADFPYLKRNGAETEPMGAKQKRFNFRLVLSGPACTSDFRKIISGLEQKPRGILIHPRLGSVKACFDTWHAGEDPGAAVDWIEFTLTFVEDGADQSITQTAPPGPSQRAGQISDSLATLETATVKYNVASVPLLSAVRAQMLTYQALANNFMIAALQAAQSTIYDPGLLQRRDLLADQRDLVLTALTNSLLYTLDTDVSLTKEREAVWQVWAAALDLYNAVIAQKPPLDTWPVPSAMSLAAVAVRLYGNDARGKMDELRRLNPHLPNAAWIQGGTLLRISVPQVRQ